MLNYSVGGALCKPARHEGKCINRRTGPKGHVKVVLLYNST